jgi:acyl-CoA synthetase (AMP-forming)/AMP-acid ligase II
MDEDGYTVIVQRKKDLIIVDGFNVYPSEVESVLYSHPAVRIAAAIGVPDLPRARSSGVHRAQARRDATAGEIIAHCRPLTSTKSATVKSRHAADERGRQENSVSRVCATSTRPRQG